MKQREIVFIFLCLSQLNLWSQSSNEIRAINNYVHFVNESIHGLLIAHRLFENYNQTVNKYVDLPEYQLNNYSNADLPGNIFEDPERWFYERSPLEWYDIAQRESKFLGSEATEINKQAARLKNLLGTVNDKRISIAELLIEKDFTQIDNLKEIYREMESVVTLYDNFFLAYKAADNELTKLEKKFQSNSNATEHAELSKSMSGYHHHVKELLYRIRIAASVDRADVDFLNKDFVAVENAVKYKQGEQNYRRILTNVSRLVKSFYEFTDRKAIPTEYDLYGPNYYYYNIEMLNKTNRYGNGFVQEFNQIAEQNNSVCLTEIPQWYKVIYPKKLPKEDLTKLDNNKLISLLDKKGDKKILTPKDIEDRNIIVHSERIIIDSSSFDLDLYDHLIKDGDRVSININGDWAFENISLEKTPQTVTIDIVPGMKNFILVRADNTGYRPPNTLALSYLYKGERKEIIIESDLLNSQLVEILYESTN